MLAILNNLVERFPNADEFAKWAVIESTCNQLLRDCDKTQLPDSGLSPAKRLEWQEYRDNLRSIQDNFSNPNDVILPTPPEDE